MRLIAKTLWGRRELYQVRLPSLILLIPMIVIAYYLLEYFSNLLLGKAKNGDQSQSQRSSRHASDINRQIEQTWVLVKSATALTSTKLRFVVVSDSKTLYNKASNLTSSWPQEYKNKVQFQYLDLWYPEEYEHMRSMFRVCATERLFLPAMLPNEDAVIYIDTDFIFMRPPEDLWAEFGRFSSQQLAAMAPCLFHYGTSDRNRVPYYGKTGLNAGIMHMNLTRMKNFPGGGWISANMEVYERHQDDIVLADQDILNILFDLYPRYLYELGCEWNYRMFNCWEGQNVCPITSQEGASLIHGNALSFAENGEMKFKVLYDSWKQYTMGSSIEKLYMEILSRLEDVTLFNKPSKCAQLKEIDTVLTDQLYRFILKNTPMFEVY